MGIRSWIAIPALIAGIASGQMNTGELGGTVTDPSGALLPNATIAAELSSTGLKFTALSNSAGTYLFAQLPVGEYSISVTSTNFKRSELARIEIHAGEKLRRDFVLQVGQMTEVLIVEGTSDKIQLESAEIKNTVQRQQVITFPLKGRQFLDLAMLTEGVVRPPGGTRGDALQQAGTLVNVLGQRSGHNLYLLDGVAVTDEYFNNMVISPSVDAIQEFNIMKTSYSPEFGGKSGAVINVITRSGANRFAGTLFAFVRNDQFDAKNFFDSPSSPIPPFRQNQFGGTLGGPIVRNKTFFFASYEGQRVRKSLTQTFSVPTDAMRSGDFSGLPVIYDPSSGSRIPFPNNRINSPLDPVAVALLERIPHPNLSGIAQNYRASERQQINLNGYTARLDHQLSSKDNLYLRTSLFDARQFDPFGSGVLQESLLPGFGRNLSTHAVNGAIGWTRAFSPIWLNELRFGFLTTGGGQSSPNAGIPFAAQTGLQGVTSDPRDMGFPQFTFGGQFSTMGDPALFTTRANRDFEIYDNAAVHRGNHTTRFGFYFMHFDFRPVNPNGARGVFSFTPRWTSSAPGLSDGNAFADFLLGYPTAAQSGLGRATIDATTNWLHYYVQDTWQIRPNFKLDVGLRYEYNQNMTESDQRFAAIDPNVSGGRYVVASDSMGQISTAANSLLPYLPIPYVTSKAAGWDESLLRLSKPRLAPRAGIAWNLPGNTKTVLRSSFGVYPNQAAYSIITAFGQNSPFFVTKTVNSIVAETPSFTTQNALATNALGTAGGANLNHDFMVEYNEVWNVNLEREFTQSTTLALAYIGSRTFHADSSTVLNVPTPGPGEIGLRRPILQLSQFNTIRWDGWAKYDAFTVNLTRRLTGGLGFGLNWTWSHSIDDASDPGATLNETNLPQNVYDRRSEKATSSFDHRHRLVVSFMYQIPIPKNASRWARAAFGQWLASGYFTAQTGAPFTVNIASDQANIGAGPAQRPNVLGDPNVGPKTPDRWFDTSVFALQPLFTFGNAPRNAVTGPGLQEVDLSLQKEVPLAERAKLQIRAEAFNLLNHPNFNIPNRIAFTPNFGRISSAQDSRQLQLALKLTF
jgi:hypothetical protein